MNLEPPTGPQSIASKASTSAATTTFPSRRNKPLLEVLIFAELEIVLTRGLQVSLWTFESRYVRTLD